MACFQVLHEISGSADGHERDVIIANDCSLLRSCLGYTSSDDVGYHIARLKDCEKQLTDLAYSRHLAAVRGCPETP